MADVPTVMPFETVLWSTMELFPAVRLPIMVLFSTLNEVVTLVLNSPALTFPPETVLFSMLPVLPPTVSPPPLMVFFLAVPLPSDSAPLSVFSSALPAP